MGLHIGKIAFPHLDAVISGLHILKIALLNSTPSPILLLAFPVLGGQIELSKRKMNE